MSTVPKKIIIKVGSSLLVDQERNELKTEWLKDLATDIHKIIETGSTLIIVSSGSVALGRPYLNSDPQTPNQKQAAAACGQPLLMDGWKTAFDAHHLKTAQILLTTYDTESRKGYLNIRDTLRNLHEQSIIPIINENDSVTMHGVLYGDNDRLAARIAAMCDADQLILLSDVDGLYTKNPNDHVDAEFMEQVETIDETIYAMASGSGILGSGGMRTKIEAAEIATRAGCETRIMNGQTSYPLSQNKRFTCFIAAPTPLRARQRWINGSITPAGTITIDEGAVKALINGSSLLHVGVTKIEGDFQTGDMLEIRDTSGKKYANGLSSMNANTAQKLIGHSSQDIVNILGYDAPKELIHRDHLVLQ
jgi:glutamate 5-kinase